MIKLLSKISFISSLLLLLGGCATSNCTLPTNLSINAEDYCQNITLAHRAIYENENKELQISVRNLTSFEYEFIYKVEWYDRNGFIISSRLNQWQRIVLKPQRDTTMDVVAPTKDAVDYLITVEKYPRIDTQKNNQLITQ